LTPVFSSDVALRLLDVLAAPFPGRAAKCLHVASAHILPSSLEPGR
jgi:hypothetical protein